MSPSETPKAKIRPTAETKPELNKSDSIWVAIYVARLKLGELKDLINSIDDDLKRVQQMTEGADPNG